MRGLGIVALAALLLAGTVQSSSGQSSPIRFVVPYAPGGAVDVLTRLLAQQISTSLGQSVVVENRPGASTGIAATYVARSAPDGLTFLVGTAATISLNPYLFTNITYKTSELQPVALLGKQPMLLVVAKEFPASSMMELVAESGSSHEPLTMATLGPGSVAHLTGEKLKSATGIDIIPVPYKGGAPALTDVMSRQVQMYFDGISSSMPHINSGKLKALGSTGETRAAAAPDVPTFAEQGFPAVTTYFWIGLFAPIGTPPPIVEKMNDLVRAALNKPELAKRLNSEGVEPSNLSVPAFVAMIEKDQNEWKNVIAKLGIKLSE
jgi:tripartite-type tricarboxylate transporter receptor subunit TctC